MKPSINLTILFVLFILLQGCNTLYYTKTVNIEILEPGSIYLSPEHKKISVRYNNFNIGFNPAFADYYDGKNLATDSSELDNEASKIYFDLFMESIQKHQFFDEIIELEPNDYWNTVVVDTVSNYIKLKQDSTFKVKDSSNTNLERLAEIIDKFPPEAKSKNKTRFLHPKLGLYSEREIKTIADTTDTDLFFSFDFFATTDMMPYVQETTLGTELVRVMSYWNVYDLKTKLILYSRFKIDTVRWSAEAYNLKSLKQQLPPRRDAILNAADIAGSKFADFLVPHWTEVQRMYYTSRHTELIKTNNLVEENRWLEAAKIWKANVDNRNKNIAAKCKFNMALVCEIEGDFEAALDWVVQSFHTLGQKNMVHFANCQQYIKIISQRILDVKKIEVQFHDNKI